MKQIEKNMKKRDTALTDHQIMQLDAEIRESKIGIQYKPTQPDDVVRCLNEIDNDMGQILAEMRRLCDILAYLVPPKQKQKE